MHTDTRTSMGTDATTDAQTPRWNRRQLLRHMGALALAASALPTLLAACGGDDDNDADNTSSTTGATATTGAGSDTGTPASDDDSDATSATSAGDTPRESHGRLRVVNSFLLASTDPAIDAWSLAQFGAAETLLRLTPDAEIEPWLAKDVEAVDATTWRIGLRANALFHDGTPVDAEAVSRALQYILEHNPAAAGYLDPATTFTVIDAQTLELTLPEPQPVLLNNLATYYLVVSQPTAEPVAYTGPYVVDQIVPDERMILRPFAEYWCGTPPLAEIEVRLMRDANARILALQAGEADIVTTVPPELVQGLGRDIEVISGPSWRVHMVVLNHQPSPVSDPAVRLAMEQAIDREILNQVALAGLGTVTTTIFPPNAGLDLPTPVATDPAAASATLEAAGWIASDDGVRVRDGERLAFTLYSYPQRPELTPMAVSMQDQLRRVGFDLSVQQVDDIGGQLESDDTVAAMNSANMLPTGDPYYALNLLADNTASTWLGYHNDELVNVVEELRTTEGTAARAAVALRAMEILQADTSQLFLIVPPRIHAIRAGVVHGFQHHPSDVYLIDANLHVED